MTRSLAYTFPGCIVIEQYCACTTRLVHLRYYRLKVYVLDSRFALCAHVSIPGTCVLLHTCFGSTHPDSLWDSLLRNTAALTSHFTSRDAAKHHSSAASHLGEGGPASAIASAGDEAFEDTVIASTSLHIPAACFPPQHPLQTHGNSGSH